MKEKNSRNSRNSISQSQNDLGEVSGSASIYGGLLSSLLSWIKYFNFTNNRSSPAPAMLLPRSQQPLRAALAAIRQSTSTGSSQVCLNEAFGLLSIKAVSPALTFVRHASHAQQGAVNKAKDGPGKRLGAKKSGGMLNHACTGYDIVLTAKLQNNM